MNLREENVFRHSCLTLCPHRTQCDHYPWFIGPRYTRTPHHGTSLYRDSHPVSAHPLDMFKLVHPHTYHPVWQSGGSHPTRMLSWDNYFYSAMECKAHPTMDMCAGEERDNYRLINRNTVALVEWFFTICPVSTSWVQELNSKFFSSSVSVLWITTLKWIQIRIRGNRSC